MTSTEICLVAAIRITSHWNLGIRMRHPYRLHNAFDIIQSRLKASWLARFIDLLLFMYVRRFNTVYTSKCYLSCLLANLLLISLVFLTSNRWCGSCHVERFAGRQSQPKYYRCRYVQASARLILKNLIQNSYQYCVWVLCLFRFVFRN